MTPDTGLSIAERVLQRLMVTAVMVSAVLLIAGLGSTLWLVGEPGTPLLITAGLVLLMTAPALRVLVAVFEAVRSRDWFYLASTLAVVVLLCLTVALALRRSP